MPHSCPTSLAMHRSVYEVETEYGISSGWGLDEAELIEDAVRVMHKHLKSRGILVVGHNRGREAQCCSFGPIFTPHSFGGLPIIHEDPQSETQHVYEFYMKNDVF